MADQLSAKDWLDLGLKTLAERGFTALKAEPLAKAMGVSRGSFYWHFADIGAYHAAILKHWREVAAEQIIAGLEAAAKDDNPLVLLLRRAFGSRLALENAVRSWATVDPVARAAVEAIDRRRLICASTCSSGPTFRQAWRVPARKSFTGRFSALRCRTSRCRRRGRGGARGTAADGVALDSPAPDMLQSSAEHRRLRMKTSPERPEAPSIQNCWKSWSAR